MAFRGLTKKGADYLATRLANELAVEFLKVEIGDGAVVSGQNPKNQTSLISYKKDVKILKKEQENNAINLTIQISNDDISQGFYLKEIGIYVNDGSNGCLYWYCNEDNAQYIPAKTDSVIAFEIDIRMEVTNSDVTIINWSGKNTWINKEFLEDNYINNTDLENKLNEKANASDLSDYVKTDGTNIDTIVKTSLTNKLKDGANLYNPTDSLVTDTTAKEFLEANYTKNGGYAGTAKEIDDRVVSTLGKEDGKFPLTEAVKGNVYYFPGNKKFYICKESQSRRVSVPDGNFEELSILENRKRLENLPRIGLSLIYAGYINLLIDPVLHIPIPNNVKKVLVYEDWYANLPRTNGYFGYKIADIDTFKKEGIKIAGQTQYYCDESGFLRTKGIAGDWSNDMCLIYFEF